MSSNTFPLSPTGGLKFTCRGRGFDPHIFISIHKDTELEAPLYSPFHVCWF